MIRTKLPERRFSVQRKILFPTQREGEQFKKLVTIGFDEKFKAREVFCGDFKAGSDTQASVMDACILVSRLLQYEDLPRDMLASMCEPKSLVGTIVEAVILEQEAMNEEMKITYEDIKGVFDAVMDGGTPNNDH